MTATTQRDRDAIYRGCERFFSERADARRPRTVLEQLAAAVDEDDRADRYGSGELVERLERRIAELLGTERAIFFVSGTMAQQIALRLHADRRNSRAIAFHATAHLQLHESMGHEWLHGLHGVVVGGRDRLIELRDLEQVGEPLAALLLELPQREIGGRLPDWDDLVTQTGWARERGVALHLDGARLWEAQPYYGRPFAEIAGLFDTVYVSFYKGLGGLAGCALAGPADVLEEARVWRIRHGGRLPSVYPFALAAELGLDRALPLMDACYRKAVDVAAELSRRDAIQVVPDPPQTPLMHVYLRGDRDRLVDAALAVAEDRRVWLFGGLADSPIPDMHYFELQIGEAGLELPTAEAGELFDEVLARAAE